MAGIKQIAPTRIGGTDIQYAQGVRAGPWLFFTGHLASDFEHGLTSTVAGNPGHPLGGAPRFRREGDFIIARLARLIAEEGGDPQEDVAEVDRLVEDHHHARAERRRRRAPCGPRTV